MNLIEFPYLMDLQGNINKISNNIFIKKENNTYFIDSNTDIKLNKIILNEKQDLKNNDILEINNEVLRFVDKKINKSKRKIRKIENKLKLSSWNFEEREYLKKSLLTFGYGNWDKILNSPDSILFKKPVEEIRSYSDSFMKSCIDNITYDNLFLKEFLIKLLETSVEDDIYIYVNYRDWDFNLIKQRANPWAKRIFFLKKLNDFINNYENYYKDKNNKYPENIFDYSDMLNFLSGSILLGQRPSIWWTRKHDIDLIVSTYKYGYGNYNINGLDQKDSHMETFYDIPTPDSISRRLKKIMQLINKESENTIDFNKKEEADTDLDNLSLDFKKAIFNLVTKLGIPLNIDLKSDWDSFKRNLEKFIDFNDNIMHSTFERLIHQFRIICNHILNESIENEDKNINFINKESANDFISNSNLFHFFRKNIMKNKYLLFTNHLEDLKILNDNLKNTDDGFIKNYTYSVEIHDIGLLEEICENGYLKFDRETVFIKNIQIKKELLLKRVRFLYNFFKLKINSTINKRKNNKTNKIIIKSAYIDINTLPCQISSTLKLLNIGKIKPENNYHSEHNLFPIGFKTIRTHASPFKKGKKCDYECEILDGGEKPIFKITCLEDPKNPIVKDTSTGCWLHFCKLANEISDNKKYKVTISGTERFGLLEPAIIRLLEDLENSDKCVKYAFKSKKV